MHVAISAHKCSKGSVSLQTAIACAQEAGRLQREAVAELRACREGVAALLAEAKREAAAEARRLRADAEAAHRLLQV